MPSSVGCQIPSVPSKHGRHKSVVQNGLFSPFLAPSPINSQKLTHYTRDPAEGYQSRGWQCGAMGHQLHSLPSVPADRRQSRATPSAVTGGISTRGKDNKKCPLLWGNVKRGPPPPTPIIGRIRIPELGVLLDSVHREAIVKIVGTNSLSQVTTLAQPCPLTFFHTCYFCPWGIYPTRPTLVTVLATPASIHYYTSHQALRNQFTFVNLNFIFLYPFNSGLHSILKALSKQNILWIQQTTVVAKCLLLQHWQRHPCSKFQHSELNVAARDSWRLWKNYRSHSAVHLNA